MLTFISSTFQDLHEERQAAQDALRTATAEPWGMEFFVSEPTKPLDVCLREVGNCDALVVIVGFFAGSIIAGSSNLTYTRAEYDEAIKLSRPIFPFIKTEHGKHVNKEIDSIKRLALEEFVAYIKAGPQTPAYFENIDQLKLETVTAINRWNELGRPGSRKTFSNPVKAGAILPLAPLFDYAQALQGRKKELHSLASFITNKAKILAVLSGRGGIGKTKLIRDFTLELDDWKVLWVSPSGVWHRETSNEIPTGKTLLISDDAHRFGDLEKLINLVEELSSHKELKLLVSTRPSGLNYVNEIIARVLDEILVERVEQLEELKLKDVTALANEVLGPKLAYLASELAEISKDTPLVTVVGGRLLARGKMLPAELANEEAFRRAVFDKFAQECEGLLPVGGSSRRDLLNLIAAVQPINPHEQFFLDNAKDFIDLRHDQILVGFDSLENVGLLTASREQLRIVPDVLADYLLEQACVTAQGRSTGFAKEVFTRFRAGSLSNLLKNLAELDWRIARRASGETLLHDIWRELTTEFANGNAQERRSLLTNVAEIVAFQPKAVMELIRLAIDTEAGTSTFYGFSTTQADVIAYVPELLEWIAFEESLTDEAVLRLWKLANTSIDKVQRSATQALKSLIGYRRYKDVVFNETILNLVNKLALEPSAFDGPVVPTDLVDEILDREVDHTERKGRAITLGALPLNYPVVKEIRERALEMIKKWLFSPHPKASTKALNSLGRVLSGFAPKFGRELNPEESTWHNNERIEALKIIRDRLKNKAPVPLMREMKRILRGLMPGHLDKLILDEARKVLNEIPSSDELQIFDALSTGAWERDSEFPTLSESTQHRERELIAAVRLFEKNIPQPEKQVKALEAMVEEGIAYGVEVKGAGEFTTSLCQNPKFLGKLAAYLLLTPQSILGPLASTVLLRLRLVDFQLYGELGKALARSENPAVCISVAQAVSYGPNLESPTQEDVDVLRELAKQSHPAVLIPAFFGIGRLGKIPSFEIAAIELAASIVLNDNERLAEAYCEMFESRGLNPNVLNIAQVGTILDKLVPIPRIGEHGVASLLNSISGNHPKLFMEFVHARLERYRQLGRVQNDTRYEVFPARGAWHFNKLRAHADYAQTLKEIRNLLLEFADEYYWLIPLFWAVATLDNVTFSFLDELLHSGERQKLDSLFDFLTEAPRSLIISHTYFAIHLVDEASRYGAEDERKMIGRICANSLSVGFSYAGAEIPSPIGKAHEIATDLMKTFPLDSPAARLFSALQADKVNWSTTPKPLPDFEEDS